MDEWHTNECGICRGKWNGLSFLFLWLNFYQIPGSALLFLWQLYFFISSWERPKQRPQDEFPEHVPVGWTAFVRSILVHMYHTRNIYKNSLMLWSFSLQKLIRSKSVKIPYFSNYGNSGERRLPMKRTIFFFAVLEASGSSLLGSTCATSHSCNMLQRADINSVRFSNSNLLMN